MVITGSNFFPESKVIFLEKGPGKCPQQLSLKQLTTCANIHYIGNQTNFELLGINIIYNFANVAATSTEGFRDHKLCLGLVLNSLISFSVQGQLYLMSVLQ